MDWECEPEMSYTLEDLMARKREGPQVGEVGEGTPIPFKDIPPCSYDENKKITDSRCIGFVPERYFKNGDSFSHVRGLIEKMRSRLKV